MSKRIYDVKLYSKNLFGSNLHLLVAKWQWIYLIEYGNN